MGIILLVGASGSGKTTIGKELERHGIEQLVSFTTRPIREGEKHGVDYYFVSEDDILEQDLIESSRYNGNTYGLFKEEVDGKLSKGDTVYFVTDSNGANQIAKLYPKEVEYFWLNITIEEMVKRMRQRGDSEKQILKRVEHAIDNKELSMPINSKANIIMLDSTQSVEELVGIITINGFLKTDEGKTFLNKVFKESNHGR